MFLILLTIVAASGGFARTALSPLQESVTRSLALTDHQMAIVQGPAVGLPMALLTLPFGALIDRYSRVRLMLVLVLVELSGTLMNAGADSFAALLISRCLAGFAGLAIFPVALALLCDVYPPESRGRATMVVSLGQVFGNAGAFALGGALLGSAGTGGNSWRSALLCMSLPLAVVMLLAFTLREPTRTRRGPSQSFAASCREIWGARRVLIPVLIGLVMMEINIGAILIWAAPALMRRFQVGAAQVGAVLATGILVSGIAGPLMGGLLADRCQSLSGRRQASGRRQTLLALSVLSLSCLPLAMISRAPSLPAASVLLFSAMTIMIGIAVMGTTLFTIIVPERSRGFCISVLVAVNVLFALGIAPLLVSLISSAMGGSARLSEALTVLVVSSSVIASGAFALGRRQAAMSAQGIEG